MALDRGDAVTPCCVVDHNSTAVETGSTPNFQLPTPKHLFAAPSARTSGRTCGRTLKGISLQPH